MPTPAPDSVFASLAPELVAALAAQGITEPTPVQSAVIPDALAGHDVLGRARTGSGKTLAFGLPILARLAGRRSRPRHPRAVVIVPTRELATQVARSMTPLAAAMRLRLTTVYGGTPYERQTRQLRQGTDIVVATPGRLEDLLTRGLCSFDDIEMTVLDEADHLCDLGFYPAVDMLVGKTPQGSQRMLLSATLDGDVDALVRTHLRDPRLHELDPNAGSVTAMTHHTLVVGGFREKVVAAVDLVRANGRTIVFTRTREGAVELAAALTERGLEAVDLHGDLSQRVRERNLQRFSSGRAQAVVATDVAARGIHVDHVDLVIHFDAAGDSKAYLHRSGRTARAGLEGCVVTITTPKFVQSVVRIQQGAAVEVLHHDLRTAPQPMTAEALAEAGHPGPVKARSTATRPAGRGSGRPQRTGGYGAKTGKPYRGQGGGGRFGERSAARTGGQSRGKQQRAR
jgi:superfamily II DNA/RNA helicase